MSDFSSRAKKSGVISLESMHICSAHSHAMERNATSRLDAQLIPIPTGLVSIQADTWSTNPSANRLSLVSQYAWPSVTKCAWRFSSHTTFGSPPLSGSSGCSLLQCETGERLPETGSKCQSIGESGG